MKKAFLYGTALFMILFTATSCSDDNNFHLPEYVSWESYGTVEAPTGSGYYVVRRDDGAKLIVTANYSAAFENKVGQRFLINYNILKDNSGDNVFQKNYNIQINAAAKVLTKGIVAQSFINADSVALEDSLGNAPILEIDKAWFGDKFLCINFTYPTNPRLGVAHMISLVNDDVALDENGNIVLTLRQNAFTDLPGLLGNDTWSEPFYQAFTRVAFDISSIVPEGQTSAKIILKWLQYSDDTLVELTTEVKSSTATFTLPLNNALKSANGVGENILVDESKYGLDKVATIVE